MSSLKAVIIEALGRDESLSVLRRRQVTDRIRPRAVVEREPASQDSVSLISAVEPLILDDASFRRDVDLAPSELKAVRTRWSLLAALKTEDQVRADDETWNALHQSLHASQSEVDESTRRRVAEWFVRWIVARSEDGIHGRSSLALLMDLLAHLARSSSTRGSSLAVVRAAVAWSLLTMPHRASTDCTNKGWKPPIRHIADAMERYPEELALTLKGLAGSALAVGEQAGEIRPQEFAELISGGRITAAAEMYPSQYELLVRQVVEKACDDAVAPFENHSFDLARRLFRQLLDAHEADEAVQRYAVAVMLSDLDEWRGIEIERERVVDLIGQHLSFDDVVSEMRARASAVIDDVRSMARSARRRADRRLWREAREHMLLQLYAVLRPLDAEGGDEPHRA